MPTTRRWRSFEQNILTCLFQAIHLTSTCQLHAYTKLHLPLAKTPAYIACVHYFKEALGSRDVTSNIIFRNLERWLHHFMSCCIIILFSLFFAFCSFVSFLLLFICVFVLFCFCFAVNGTVKLTIKLHERVDRCNVSVTTGFVCSEIKTIIFFWKRLNMF